MIRHERMFKMLLEAFFEEFVMLFPRSSRSHRLHNDHIFDLVEGEKRVVDLLVKTRIRGEESLMLSHMET